jgi:membrane protease YdiL (CAAX protease family)
MIYIVFSPYRPVLDNINRTADYLGRLGLVVVLWAAVWLTRKYQSLEKYSQILLGLSIMAIAVTMDWVFSIYLIRYLGVDGNSPFGYALQKLNQCFIVVSVVVGLSLLSGGTLGSIYIQKGRLKLGLIIGLVTFGLAALGSTVMAVFLFKGQNLTAERILIWLPWLLIFVLANAAQEELLFRGLFLRKLQPFFGGFLSNFLIVVVFTLLHYGASYTSDNAIFLAAVFPLGLAWGYLMQKTNGIWASILFHAGMDIPIMLGMFSNL